MRALVIAIGNPLRRDDGVAHAVRLPPGVERRDVLQLTPELAEEIAPYDAVVFIDADASAGELRIEPVNSLPSASPLTHVSKPAEIVALARALFGFSGGAYACRIPASEFSIGRGLSPGAKGFASQVGREIGDLLATKTLAYPLGS